MFDPVEAYSEPPHIIQAREILQRIANGEWYIGGLQIETSMVERKVVATFTLYPAAVDQRYQKAVEDLGLDKVVDTPAPPTLGARELILD